MKDKITKSEIEELYESDQKFHDWYDKCRDHYKSYFIQKNYKEADRMLLSLNRLLYKRPIRNVCPICGTKLYRGKFCSKSCSNSSLGRDQSSLAAKINKKCSEMMIGNESVATIKARNSFVSRWKNGMVKSEVRPRHAGKHGHIKGWIDDISYYSAQERDLVEYCIASELKISNGSYVEYWLDGIPHNYYFDYFIGDIPCEVKSWYWLERDFEVNVVKFESLLTSYGKMFLVLDSKWYLLDNKTTVEIKLRELLGTPKAGLTLDEIRMLIKGSNNNPDATMDNQQPSDLGIG